MRGAFKQSPLPAYMDGALRVLVLDLLVERSEFGHGGNQEVVSPMAKDCDVEVLLVTPQMQSIGSGREAARDGLVLLSEKDVPHWDYDYDFWSTCEIEMNGNSVRFTRIALPMEIDDQEMKDWVGLVDVDAVVCSGSRRNVTMWEDWMDSAASLMRVASTSGMPTLGICFGHQLLCKSLGSKVIRAESMSSGVWDLSLNEAGIRDELFELREEREGGPVVLYSHQDHVTTVPECCELLGSAEHNFVTAVRVIGSDGKKMPAWGLQFHPEAAKHRIERSFGGGHITEDEMMSFQREHDGAGVLEAFANVVLNHRR